MESQIKTIIVSDFISFTVSLCRKLGSRVIRRFVEEGNIQGIKKEDDTLVTKADLIIQKSLEFAYAQRYPGLVIKGEEETSKIEQSEIISPDESFLGLGPFEGTFNTEEAIVYIDPLDGTHCFLRGQIDSVTILVGVAIKGKASIGIIHSEFFDTDFQTREKHYSKLSVDRLLPVTFFGTENQLYSYCNSQLVSIHAYNPSNTLNFTKRGTKLLRGPPLQEVNQLCEIGGAGNKCLHILTQRIDCYISMSLDKWDICAGEVIVKGCGGSVTDFKGFDINYDKPIETVIVAGSKEVFKRVKNSLPQL